MGSGFHLPQPWMLEPANDQLDYDDVSLRLLSTDEAGGDE